MTDHPNDLGRRPLLDSLTPAGGFASDGRVPLRANPDPFFQTDVGLGFAVNTAALEIVIDGGGAVITTGEKGDLEVPFTLGLIRWTLMADQSGSIKVDVWYDVFANFPPTNGDTITNGDEPELSSAVSKQADVLKWSQTVLQRGSVLRFNVDSITTIQRVTLSLFGVVFSPVATFGELEALDPFAGLG